MYDAMSGMPFLEAEVAYRHNRLLAEAERRRAVRSLRRRAPRRRRTRFPFTRRSQVAAAR